MKMKFLGRYPPTALTLTKFLIKDPNQLQISWNLVGRSEIILPTRFDSFYEKKIIPPGPIPKTLFDNVLD